MGQRIDEIRALGAELIAIAVTPIYAQQAFASSLEVDFPLLSDWGGATARAYGVEYDVWKGHAGLAKRSIFLVGTGGLVRYRWVTDDAMIQPDIDEIIAALGAV